MVFSRLPWACFGIFITLALLSSCGHATGQPSKTSLADIGKAPKVHSADEKYAHVYQMLDGEWRGEFFIYESKLGQSAGGAQPNEFNENLATRPDLRLKMKLSVRQIYRSETPYFQRVSIWDTYQKSNGKTVTVESEGANKIHNGVLWCVVKKPDETVIHQGQLSSKNTIIWQRDIRRPNLKVEYFKETVHKNTYSIRGWGYYGQDDPNKAPRLWFSADYKRVTK